MLHFPTYPAQSTGVAVEFDPVPWLTGSFGWFDGTTGYYDAGRGTTWSGTGTRGPKSFFDNPGSWFFITELDARWTLGATPLPGSLQVGYWWQTGPVAFGEEDPIIEDGSEGPYIGGAQTILNLSGDQAATSSIALMGQLAWGEEQSNPVTFSAFAGVVANGLVPGRDDDQIGLQVNYARFSDAPLRAPFPGSWQLGVEAYYRIQLTPSVAIQPDIQWFERPDGDASLRDAVVATLRVEISF